MNLSRLCVSKNFLSFLSSKVNLSSFLISPITEDRNVCPRLHLLMTTVCIAVDPAVAARQSGS